MKISKKLFVGILLSAFLLNTSLFYSCNSNIENKPSDTIEETTEDDSKTDESDEEDKSDKDDESQKDENSEKDKESKKDDESDKTEDTTKDENQSQSENQNKQDENTDSENQSNQENNSNQQQPETPVAKNVDCEITATDLGNWTECVSIPASKFASMVSGDYITITTVASPTNASTAQLGLCDGQWENIGSDGTCSNVSSYSSEYKCYTLNAAAQNTVFSPSDSVIETLKSKGMIIKGQGVQVTAVVIRVNAKLDENNNPEVTPIISDLCDSSATENAKHLFKYIKAMYGSKVITGQMENAWNNDFNQLGKVYASTGKYPALMGFDFMDYTGISWDASSFNKQTERAINFWNGKDWEGNKISDNQGIVAFCWHWFDPLHQDYSYKPGDGTEGTTTFRIPYDTENDSWDTSSAAYTAMKADMDVIAAELLKLQTAGVPVLWRPLHEGAGNVGLYNNTGTAWFWWGAGNSTNEADMKNADLCGECYIALWKWMYQYFTETKGLHNLIWVWNGQNAKFYPGADYVDMIGDDIYFEASNGDTPTTVTSSKAKFQIFQAMDTTKPVAMTECGTLPDIETDGALWSFFMIWNDSSSSKSDTAGNYWNGEHYNSDARKTSVYNSATAITLDELPDLTTY